MTFLLSNSIYDEEASNILTQMLEICYEGNVVPVSSAKRKQIDEILKGRTMYLPLISEHFMKSRHCMVELGYFYAQQQDHDCIVIPISISQKAEIELLSQSLLEGLTIYSFNSGSKIKEYLKKFQQDFEFIKKDLEEDILESCINKIVKIATGDVDITEGAQVLAMCSNLNYMDAVSYTKENTWHKVDYDFLKYGEKINCEFISVAFTYEEKLNLYKDLRKKQKSFFQFEIECCSNLFSHIDVEFKYKNQRILKKYEEIEIKDSKQQIQLPISIFDKEGLKEIEEISFIIWKRYLKKEQGSFWIKNVKLI